MDTRERILQSALSLFLAQGYRETPVAEVVEKAGVTKGAFYYYFKSKEDLVLLAHRDYLVEILDILHVVVREHDDAAEQLQMMIEHLVRGVAAYRAELAIFLEQRRLLNSDPRFAEVKKLRDQFEFEFIDLVDRGMRSGRLRSGMDPRIAGLAIVGMITWGYQWMPDTEDDAYYHEVAKTISTIGLKGLGVRTPEHHPS